MIHQKHTDLARPQYGTFARNEWAIIGTPCGNIQQLARTVISALSASWKCGYVDADHKAPDTTADSPPTALGAGAALEYTDKISHHRFDFVEKPDAFRYRAFFENTDAVLVNGNHFPAKNQIVVIDPKKEESLSRKLDKLTNVQLILLTGDLQQPFPFLKDHIGNWQKIPVLPFTDTERIIAFFEEKIQTSVPPLFGLVLAGGKSLRMGQDKGLLDYHGQPQRIHAANLLRQLCRETYLSCRADQADMQPGEFPVLPDTFTGLGPMGAILSAFRERPDAAWLVTACDLPLLDAPSLQFLVENRNPSLMATSFRSPESGFPEPLVAIWEPRSYPVLLRFLAQGYSCPRKVLINSPIALLEPPEPNVLRNANTPEEYKEIVGMLRG